MTACSGCGYNFLVSFSTQTLKHNLYFLRLHRCQMYQTNLRNGGSTLFNLSLYYARAHTHTHMHSSHLPSSLAAASCWYLGGGRAVPSSVFEDAVTDGIISPAALQTPGLRLRGRVFPTRRQRAGLLLSHSLTLSLGTRQGDKGGNTEARDVHSPESGGRRGLYV